jgi:hypothetical protein
MSSADLDPPRLAERIEQLLEGITSSGGPAVGHAAEELVQLLMRFYGSGLEQLVAIAKAGGGDTLVHRMAADPLVGGLFALHDLHPVPLAERLEHALQVARRKLGSHGEGVRLAGVDPDGQVHVEIAGGGCGMDTIKDLVTTSITELAPEVGGVVFDAAPVGPTLLQIGVRPPERVPSS